MQLRAMVLQFVLCCSLMNASYASAVIGTQCDAAASSPGDAPSAMPHHGHRGAGVTRDTQRGEATSDTCKCPVKCSCSHLCAAGNASMALDNVATLRIDTIAAPHTFHDARIPTHGLSDVFRPPCVAHS